MAWYYWVALYFLFAAAVIWANARWSKRMERYDAIERRLSDTVIDLEQRRRNVDV